MGDEGARENRTPYDLWETRVRGRTEHPMTYGRRRCTEIPNPKAPNDAEGLSGFHCLRKQQNNIGFIAHAQTVASPLRLRNILPPAVSVFALSLVDHVLRPMSSTYRGIGSDRPNTKVQTQTTEIRSSPSFEYMSTSVYKYRDPSGVLSIVYKSASECRDLSCFFRIEYKFVNEHHSLP
ncbi:hypothetical protein RRG08_020470 [Elysia crispata]|uniref:Uncharacterized protein n=1 Tax=Elysia crispata TaxID=231223 RepID=A0AAE1DVP3_9GAST|nr:hypothetical protein RRG08_020470 [Elysia crispata]